MSKKQVFFSFHYDNDVMRTQQIRNIGVIEGKKPISHGDWEDVKRKGDSGIEKWINETMADCDCVVVLVGEETADREWIQYEIKRAWETNKGLIGIYIHNIKCPRNGKCNKGENPFDSFIIEKDNKEIALSEIIQTYDPVVMKNNSDSASSYKDIEDKLAYLVEEGIKTRGKYADNLPIKKISKGSEKNYSINISKPSKPWAKI